VFRLRIAGLHSRVDVGLGAETRGGHEIRERAHLCGREGWSSGGVRQEWMAPGSPCTQQAIGARVAELVSRLPCGIHRPEAEVLHPAALASWATALAARGDAI